MFDLRRVSTRAIVKPHSVKSVRIRRFLVKSVRIWSFSVVYFPAFGLKKERYHSQSECGKIRTRKLRIRTLFMQWHVTRILLFEEVFSNFLLSIWFFCSYLLIYLFSCSFYCSNEFPFREFLTYSLHISFHSFNKFYFSLMLYISLLVYLLLRLQFENPNEIYSKVFPRPIHPNSGYVHIWHKFKCKYFWMSGKLPPVRVRVWFRISARKATERLLTEAVAQVCSVKKVFLEISQNSQENTCARVSFLIKLQAAFLQNNPGGCFCFKNDERSSFVTR